MVEPPDHPVYAIPGGPVAGKEQNEFIWNIEFKGINAHAAVGNIGNEAVAWRRAAPKLDFRQTFKGVARRPALLLVLSKCLM